MEIEELLPGFKGFMGFIDEFCKLSEEEELARMRLRVEREEFGPYASESPRHRHRIEMKRLELEKITIERALLRMEPMGPSRDEMLDVYKLGKFREMEFAEKFAHAANATTPETLIPLALVLSGRGPHE